MRHFLIQFCMLTVFKGSYTNSPTSDNELEDVFGLGAEDNEENILQTLPDNSILSISEDIIKSTRQDPEDVEMFLSPGPMTAPDIILKGFVDSRVSLSPFDEVLKKSQNKPPPDNMDMEMGNSILEDEQVVYDDDMSSHEHKFDSLSAQPLNDLQFSLNNPDPPCFKSMNGAFGSFNLSFDQDCIMQITSPNEDSRLIMSCSPIELGDCPTYKDSLSVNMMGDTRFRQNSFTYCGPDANIRAISIRNKLAVRVKKTDIVSGSTFCTYHSRRTRQFNSDNPDDVPCGRLGRIGKIVGGRRVPPGLFPWAVQLDITRLDGTQTGCTGTIISPHYVLTAAHCMKRAESVSAFMGGTDRLDIIGTELLIQAEKYILHKKWSSRTLVADIALVKLTQPIQYSEDIRPICLPEGKLLTEDMSGRRGVAIGWGRTETRKKAPRRLYRIKLPLLSDSNCRNIYRRFYIPKVMMCTDSKKDAAICYGMSRNF